MRLIALVLSVLAALALPADAGQDDARRAVRSGEALPLSEILSGLRGRYPGRVLDADIAERGRGDWTYGIRLLNPQGRVVELDVDARSGKVLRERGGRGDGGGLTAPGFAPQGGHWRRSDDDRERGGIGRDRSRGRGDAADNGRRDLRRDQPRGERSYRHDDRRRDRSDDRGYDRRRDRDRGPERSGRGRGRERGGNDMPDGRPR